MAAAMQPRSLDAVSVSSRPELRVLAGGRGQPVARRRCHPPGVYLRRRLAAVALVLVTAAGLGQVLGALGGGPLPAAERTPAMQPVSRGVVVVQPGDTLWSIARELQPTGDVRPLVDALAAGRGGRPLQAGERIELPR